MPSVTIWGFNFILGKALKQEGSNEENAFSAFSGTGIQKIKANIQQGHKEVVETAVGNL